MTQTLKSDTEGGQMMTQLPERPGMALLHYDHDHDEPCSPYCYYVLPQRPFTTQTHGHEQGESCLWSHCYYQPTLLGRLLRRLRR